MENRRIHTLRAPSLEDWNRIGCDRRVAYMQSLRDDAVATRRCSRYATMQSLRSI